MSGRIIPTVLRKGQRFPGIRPSPTFWPLGVGLGTVRAPLGMSFSLLMCYNECILKTRVQLNFTCLPSWIHLILISLCCVLVLCHSFKGYAVPPSLPIAQGQVYFIRKKHHQALSCCIWLFRCKLSQQKRKTLTSQDVADLYIIFLLLILRNSHFHSVVEVGQRARRHILNFL